MTTITWTIGAIDYNIVNGKKVATTLHWRCNGVDADGNTGGSYGTQPVSIDDTRTAVDWESITEQQAIDWLLADMSVVTMDGNEEGNVPKSQKDTIEGSVNAQVDEKANPTRGTGLPWAAPEAITMDIKE
jgi:hypothetical protein